jgi:hypothetical protein
MTVTVQERDCYAGYARKRPYTNFFKYFFTEPLLGEFPANRTPSFSGLDSTLYIELILNMVVYF